mgnify:CR=1 FL=1
MRKLISLLCVAAMSCAGGGVAPTATPREPAPTPTPKPKPKPKPGVAPCGGSQMPSPDADHLAAVKAARAARRAGAVTGSSGFYQVVLPPGFRRDDRAPQFEEGEINPGRVHAFTHSSTDTYVFVEVRRHPAVATTKSSSLRTWAEAVLWKFEPLAKDSVGSSAGFIDHVPVYFAAWRDSKGRRNIEYAYVQKGCERGEIYERFVEVAGALLRVTVDINGMATPSEAAPWLDVFFDAPLGTSAPAERRFAYGLSTNL